MIDGDQHMFLIGHCWLGLKHHGGGRQRTMHARGLIVASRPPEPMVNAHRRRDVAARDAETANALREIRHGFAKLQKYYPRRTRRDTKKIMILFLFVFLRVLRGSIPLP